MVTSWILNPLTRDIAESVIFSDSVTDIWSELEDRFGQSNGAKLYQLQKDLISISQGTSDIATYYTKIKRFWDELSAVLAYPACTCGAIQSISKFEQDQHLIQFLMGLNSDYNIVRGNILMMKSSPTIGQAYALLVQEEKQREIHASSNFLTESASMNAMSSQPQGNYRGKYDGKKPMICSHCKKPGHPASKCYRLVGFPKDVKFTKGKKISAAAYGENDKENDNFNENSGQCVNNLGGFTQDQCNQLLMMLNKSQIIGKSAGEASSSQTCATANFAGPFSEEATGTW